MAPGPSACELLRVCSSVNTRSPPSALSLTIATGVTRAPHLVGPELLVAADVPRRAVGTHTSDAIAASHAPHDVVGRERHGVLAEKRAGTDARRVPVAGERAHPRPLRWRSLRVRRQRDIAVAAHRLDWGPGPAGGGPRRRH